MDFSIIIPARNEEHYIAPCLESILRHGAGGFSEVIVIDNASTDRTAEVARRFPGVRVVSEPEKGLTKARQRGLAEARGSVLAYVDADTRMPRDWMQIAEDVFSRHPDVVSLSGPYRYYDGSRWRNAIMHSIWRICAPVGYAIAGYMILGGNFVVRKDALVSAGGFDTTIEFYGEDTDLARRLHRQGRVIFRMDFFIYSSSRRLIAEGFFKTNAVYAINFIWEVLFGRPFTRAHRDIRILSA